MEPNSILESLGKLKEILNGRTMKDLLSNVDTQLLAQTTGTQDGLAPSVELISFTIVILNRQELQQLLVRQLRSILEVLKVI